MTDDELERELKESRKIIDSIIHQYEPEEFAICFNGGKDCTVLLHILLQFKLRRIKALYIRPVDSFEEIDQFVFKCAHKYDMDLITIEGHLKQALCQFQNDFPNVKCLFMGTRCTDPHAQKEVCEYTDPDWPKFLRVCPLLNWTYKDIWAYLLREQIPYCTLYDSGYTSIGTKVNTKPNPCLKTETGFSPAFMLTDGRNERCGRTK